MTAVPSPTPRRDRLRAQALAEIKTLAMAQIAKGGPDALSLNAIARAMGMSGPAIYRYFAGRDALLTALVTDLYGELADALEHAAGASSRRGGPGRLRALADAYRSWALAHPREYVLVFATGAPGGGEDAPEVVAASHRSMELLIRVLAEIASGAGPEDPPSTLPRTTGPTPPPAPALDRSLRGWAAARGDEDVSVHVLRLGVLAWSRLHGIVSLELEGAYAAMGVDAGALYRLEVDELARDAAAD